jgi:POT family proton-dependent oligopeptide transporter
MTAANSHPAASAPPAPPGGEPDRYPPQIKYIIGNEACERFTYYGLMGILELYLVNRMTMGEAQATQTLHLFGTAVYFLPLLGGWLADRWFGRYWTILSISLVYCLGCGGLALFEGSPTALFLGLALIAVGAGGIKPCVSAFVGDQFGPEQQHLLPRVYGWFYWAINLGSAGGFFIIPWVHTRASYRWAFALPGAAMALATLFFWRGTKYYVRRPAAPPNERLHLVPVILYALARCLGRKPGEKFLDPALRHFPPQDIEGARTVLGILGIFASIPMFWTLFNQVNSTWVLQGKNMAPFYWLNGETMQGAGALLVMIWVPILTLWIYPLAERLGLRPTPLRRMSAGMALGAAAFFISGLIQARMDRHAALSILWQLAPYTVLEAGEVMVSATALEFAFAQAPSQLKSVIMSFWLMTIAAGHFLIAVFTYLNQRFVNAKGASEFWFYATLMLAVAAIFIAVARRYRQKPNLPGFPS